MIRTLIPENVSARVWGVSTGLVTDVEATRQPTLLAGGWSPALQEAPQGRDARQKRPSMEPGTGSEFEGSLRRPAPRMKCCDGTAH